MPLDLASHPYFQPWTDPQTGVVSYLLTERLAPLQKGLYFVTPSLSADGRWLWFQAAFPPSRKWITACARLDADRPDVRYFPATAGGGGNPLVKPGGDAAYIVVGDGIYLQPYDGEPEHVARMPGEIIGGRYLFKLVTDLTLSADGRYFVLDSHIGNRWLVSLADVKTGEVTPLRWFFRCHHHAMFSKTDPELLLVNQGPWHDPITGNKGDMNIRMWLMDTKLTRYEPLFGDLWFNHTCMSCHEWWTEQGTICWCDYNDGVYECDPSASPRTRELIWPQPVCHAQCDPSGRFFVGDENPYHRTGDRPCRVHFFDRQTGRQTSIVSKMALPDLPPSEWRPYHLDPHPHFSADGTHIVYTATVRGTVDVAVTPVEGILEKMG